MYNNITNLATLIAYHPHDVELNFKMGQAYEEIEQLATAVSFYLRAAEYGVDTHPELVYASLLRIGQAFETEGGRNWSTSGAYLQAMAYQPSKPDAYYYLSRFYERTGSFQESYTFANAGLALPDIRTKHTGYSGKYMLLFEKAVSGWRLGRKDEAESILLDLFKDHSIDAVHRTAVMNNLKNLNIQPKESVDPLEPVVTNYRKFFGSKATNVLDIGTRDGDDAAYLGYELFCNDITAIDAGEGAVNLTKSRYPWMNVLHTAVSNYNGTVTFHELMSGDKELDGCSSIALKGDDLVQNSPQREITVPCARIDSLIESGRIPLDVNGNLDVVKIDVEGFSWQVLDGFGKYLSKVKVLHVEAERRPFHDEHKLIDDIIGFMKVNGFYLADASYEWGEGIQDQVWINKNLAIYNRTVFNDFV